MEDPDYTEEQRQEAIDALKSRYEDETGHQLPDHVIENLHLLSGVSILKLVEYRKLTKKRRGLT